MALSAELKKIKQIYGEEFMHLCRQCFPTILDDEGMLISILTDNFANNARLLARDIKEQDKEDEFKEFIYTKYNKTKRKQNEKQDVGKNPFEILKEHGYTLYEATNEFEIQSYKKYYAKKEELCTFNGGRLNKCICFWAIKDNAELIDRTHFVVPKREDDYSTSVLAIQFTKHGNCRVSIKSRYNHSVTNPDATYGNNLEKIAPGLTISFERLLRERGYELTEPNEECFNLKHYKLGGDGRFYRYNIREYGAFYCPGNVVLTEDEHVENLVNTEQQVLIDNYILDLKDKTIRTFPAGQFRHPDDFIEGLINIEKIERVKDKLTGNTTFTLYLKGGAPATIVVDDLNRIVEYDNPNLTRIGDGFMRYNLTLRKFNASKIKKIGDSFLYRNDTLEEIDLSGVESIGYNFLTENRKIKKVKAPMLKKVDNYFLQKDNAIESLVAPELKEVGDYFLASGEGLSTLEVPKLEVADASFIRENRTLTKVDFPNLKKAGNSFLYSNRCITKINAPNLTEVGYAFMHENRSLVELKLPRLEKTEDSFLEKNNSINIFEAPRLKKVGSFFMAENKTITNFKALKLKEVPYGFFESNEHFKNIKADKKYVFGIDLAKLDKENEVAEEELSKVESAIRWFRERIGLEINNRDDR